MGETPGMRKLEKIEEDIKKSKLREVKRMKEELEQKLASLNENVNVLSGSPRVKKEKEPAMSKEDKARVQAELEQKRKEAEEFIRKVKDEKRERRHKEQEREREAEERRQKEAEKLNRKLRQKEEELLRRRKEETRKTYQTLKQKREVDLKRFEEQKSKSVLPPEQDYLYKKLEDRYNREVLLPILESKKLALAKKRNIYQPINKEELDEHMRKHESLMAQKEEEREKEQRERRKREESVHQAIQKFQTHAQERVSLEEEKLREDHERKKGEKQARREKMESYATLVKETLPIKVNLARAAELKKQIEQLKHPVRQSRDLRKKYDLAVINRRGKKSGSAAQSVDRVEKKKAEAAEDIGSARMDRSTEANKKRGSSSTTENQAAMKSAVFPQKENEGEPQAQAKKIDYLAELRKKREDNYVVSKSIRYDWKKDLNDKQLNIAEKYNRVVGKADKIEEQAKMREKVLQTKGGAEKNPEMGEYVSDMFIDAIKAKLAILENL